MDPFLSILISRKWTKPCKKNRPSVGFCVVLDMRGKVPGRMDPFLSILISRTWTEPHKINCPNVGFCNS